MHWLILNITSLIEKNKFHLSSRPGHKFVLSLTHWGGGISTKEIGINDIQYHEESRGLKYMFCRKSNQLFIVSYLLQGFTRYDLRPLIRRRHLNFSRQHLARMTEAQTQSRPKILNFITGNANKLAEVRAILSDVPGLQMQSRDVPGLSEIQGTIEEVAIDKASKAAAVVSGFPQPYADHTGRHIQGTTA